MSLITRMLRQPAVFWAASEPNQFGQYTYDVEPVEIKCRWEDRQEEFIGKDGTRQLSRSVVYVDRDMKTGDKLWLGTLDAYLEHVSSGDAWTPDKVTDSWEVRIFDKLPKLRATEFLRTCFL